jgi:small subunit ribosomal protein S6
MPRATDIQPNDLQSLADAPKTSREYETIYILRPGTTNEGVAEVNQRVRGVIESMGGKVMKVDNWGKRRLAYEIEKERKGIYLHWQYLATRGVVDEIERNMRMLDSVIRYMSLKLDADIDPEGRATEIDEEAYQRAANTAADEEDMYLTRSEEGEPGFGDDDDEDGGFGADDDDDDVVADTTVPAAIGGDDEEQ